MEKWNWNEERTRQEEAWESFGASVRRRRVALGLSQERLAHLAALNVRTIAKIEAGELPLRGETIGRLEVALGGPAASTANSAENPDSLASILRRLSLGRVTRTALPCL